MHIIRLLSYMITKIPAVGFDPTTSELWAPRAILCAMPVFFLNVITRLLSSWWLDTDNRFRSCVLWVMSPARCLCAMSVYPHPRHIIYYPCYTFQFFFSNVPKNHHWIYTFWYFSNSYIIKRIAYFLYKIKYFIILKRLFIKI